MHVHSPYGAVSSAESWPASLCDSLLSHAKKQGCLSRLESVQLSVMLSAASSVLLHGGF